jgi:hypothetical protein
MESVRSGSGEWEGKKKVVVLEAGHDDDVSGDLSRTKSVIDEDLDELKGCFDLGIGIWFQL